MLKWFLKLMIVELLRFKLRSDDIWALISFGTDDSRTDDI